MEVKDEILILDDIDCKVEDETLILNIDYKVENETLVLDKEEKI